MKSIDKMRGSTCGRKLPLATAMLALIVPVVIGLVDVSQLSAQSTKKPEFDVTAIRQHAGPLSPNTLVNPTVLPGGRFVSRTFLRILIAYAYKVPVNRSPRITGFPDWMAVDLRGDSVYDIEATSAMPAGLSIEARDDRVRAMVQALLIDRFKLVIRRESKEMPVYALVVAKGGPKLQRADIGEKDCPESSIEPVGLQPPIPSSCHAIIGGIGRGVHARAATISELAAYMENWTDRPLIDKTGIEGLYRFDTKPWRPINSSMEARPTDIADGTTVFQMFENMGLRMEPQKGVVDVYVIERLEKPSEN